MAERSFSQIRSQILADLAVYTAHPSSSVTIPYGSFKFLYDHLLRCNHPFPISKKSILRTLSELRGGIKVIAESFLSTKKSFGNQLLQVKEEFARIRANYLCTLLQFSNSLFYMKEQLAKVSKLIENSLYAFCRKERSKPCNSHSLSICSADPGSANIATSSHSKTFILLQPIQQFVESVLQRIRTSDAELKSVELYKGFTFSTFMKRKGELTAEEYKKVETLLKNPIISARLSKQKLKSSRPPSAQVPCENNLPSPTSSCSVTELEDFVYNLLHSSKAGGSSKDQFTKDVSLADLLAMSKNPEEIVPSPIATTAGCLKDLEAVSKSPEAEFDPKKIKKIEFSDDKVGDAIKEMKEPTIHDVSIDNIALNTKLRNQSQNEIMKYKDYVKQCKQEAKDKSPLQLMLGSDEVSATSLMSSFDLPQDTKESYASLKSSKAEMRMCASKKKYSTRIDQTKEIDKAKVKFTVEDEYKNHVEIKPKEEANKCPDLSKLLHKKEAKVKESNMPSVQKSKKSSEAYSAYYTNTGSNCEESFVYGKPNGSFYQPAKYRDGLKRSKSIISIPDGISLNMPEKNRNSNKRIEKTKSVRSLKKKTEGEKSVVRLPSLVEDKKGHLPVKKLKRLLGKDSNNSHHQSSYK